MRRNVTGRRQSGERTSGIRRKTNGDAVREEARKRSGGKGWETDGSSRQIEVIEVGKGRGRRKEMEVVSDRVRKRKTFSPPDISGGCC